MPDVAVADITAKSAVENFIFLLFLFLLLNVIISLQYCRRVIVSCVAYQTMPPSLSNGLFIRGIAKKSATAAADCRDHRTLFFEDERAAWSLKKDLPIVNFNWEPIQ